MRRVEVEQRLTSVVLLFWKCQQQIWPGSWKTSDSLGNKPNLLIKWVVSRLFTSFCLYLARYNCSLHFWSEQTSSHNALAFSWHVKMTVIVNYSSLLSTQHLVVFGGGSWGCNLPGYSPISPSSFRSNSAYLSAKQTNGILAPEATHSSSSRRRPRPAGISSVSRTAPALSSCLPAAADNDRWVCVANSCWAELICQEEHRNYKDFKGWRSCV